MKKVKLQIALFMCALMFAGCGGKNGNTTGDRQVTTKQTESSAPKSPYIRNKVPDTSDIDIFDVNVYEKMAEAYYAIVDEIGGKNSSVMCDINHDNLPEMVVFYTTETEEEFSSIYTYDGKKAVMLVEAFPCADGMSLHGVTDLPLLHMTVSDREAQKSTIYEYNMDDHDITVFVEGTATPIPDTVVQGWTIRYPYMPADVYNDERSSVVSLDDSKVFYPDRDWNQMALYNMRRCVKWKGMFLEEPVPTDNLPKLSDIIMIDINSVGVPTYDSSMSPLPFALEIPVPAISGGEMYYPEKENVVFSVRVMASETNPNTEPGGKSGHTTPGGNYTMTDVLWDGEHNDTMEEVITIYSNITNTHFKITLEYAKGYLWGLDRAVLEDLESYREVLWETIAEQLDAADAEPVRTESTADSTQTGAGGGTEADYEDAIDQYRSALRERPSEYGDLQKMESDYPVAKGYVEWLYYYIDPVLFDTAFFYTLYDVNGDGTEEMLVLMFEPYSGVYILTDVISVVAGRTESILNAGARWRIYVQDDGLIAYNGSGGMSRSASAYRIGDHGEAVQVFDYEESRMADDSISKTVLLDDGSLTEARKEELKNLPWDAPAVPDSISPSDITIWKTLR